MTRVAYLCEPHVGGMYSFFQKMRPALAARNMDFRCVCPFPGRLYQGSRYEDEEGVDYLDLHADPAKATEQIVAHVEQAGYATLVILPGCYEIASNLPRYLPRTVRCVARLPHNARGVYLPTQWISPYLDRIVAVSDRLKLDLVKSYRVDEKKIEVIYNGIDVPDGAEPAERQTDEPCRLLFVGRIEDLQKNVFLLPVMMRKLAERGIDCHLTVVGKGADREALLRRFERLGLRDRLDAVGERSHDDMQAIWRASHLLLLPSRFEGSPNAVLEAMARGCVPVLSRLPGITDVVVEQDVSGLLCKVGSAASFADAVARLANDDGLRVRMGLAAIQRVKHQFTLARMVQSYADLFRELQSSPPRDEPPLPLHSFEMPRVLGPTWRRFVPRQVKKAARTMMERLGRSV